MSFRHPDSGSGLFNEVKVLSEIKRLTGCLAQSILINGYSPDYWLIKNNKIKAVCEIKGRSYDFGVKPIDKSVNIGYSKFYHCLNMAKNSGKPFYLILTFLNGIYFYRYTEGDEGKFTHLDSWGRYDRGDKYDIEPAVSIPIALFKPLSTIKKIK